MSVKNENSDLKQHLQANFVTGDQFAEAMGRSRRTIDRWHAMRIGPARIKRGKLILYRIEAVEDWLKACESKLLR